MEYGWLIWIIYTKWMILNMISKISYARDGFYGLDMWVGSHDYSLKKKPLEEILNRKEGEVEHQKDGQMISSKTIHPYLCLLQKNM